jgi:hypothetical protein
MPEGDEFFYSRRAGGNTVVNSATVHLLCRKATAFMDTYKILKEKQQS